MNLRALKLAMTSSRNSLGRYFASLCLAVFLSAHGPATVAAEPDTSCAVPPYLHPKLDSLPNTTRRLQANEPLRVLFLGSGAMAGIGASAKTEAFPAQFARLLPERVANLRIESTNLAEERSTLSSAVNTMNNQLDTLKPDLVIWQVGLNDIAARPPLIRFDRDLTDGIAVLAARPQTDLLLLDVPFYPGLELLLNDAEYRRVIEFRADLDALPLFPTHDLMAYWSERRTFERNMPAQLDTDQSLYLADKMHYCIGNILAGYVARVTTKK